VRASNKLAKYFPNLKETISKLILILLPIIPKKSLQVKLVKEKNTRNEMQQYHLTRTPSRAPRRFPMHTRDPPKLPLLFIKC
jgi:hypothetical protein